MRPTLHSGVYEGWVRHRRREPVGHAFTFPLFMMYLDLSEIPRVFERRWLWSSKRFNVAWFRRADYLGDPRTPLDEAVRDRVEGETGERPVGPIRMLTHLRYLGVCFNPVTFYYCYDASGERVETIVAEITNTPWKERHSYVLPVSRATRVGDISRSRFQKDFHVSPFMPMEIEYDWSFSDPSERIFVHMNLVRGDRRTSGVRVFDATMELTRREISGASLARVLAVYPAMTARVVLRIHLEAFKLWRKGAVVYAHPGAADGTGTGAGVTGAQS